MIQLTDKVWVIELPADATNIVMHNYSDAFSKLAFSSKIQDPAQCGGDIITLPWGYWRYICTSKEVTLSEAAKIVKGDMDGWKDYEGDNKLPLPNPMASLNSLLASKGLSKDKNYCLIEKM